MQAPVSDVLLSIKCVPPRSSRTLRAPSGVVSSTRNTSSFGTAPKVCLLPSVKVFFFKSHRSEEVRG